MIVNNIKKLCERDGISISAVEKELGFSPKSIYRWDENSPSIERVKAVANFFGVTVDALISEMPN